MEILSWISENWGPALVGIQAVLGGLIALALLVPGEQPEKFLQSILDFLKKLSAK